MERYQQHRTASISRDISIYYTGWGVQADEEDGTVEIIISFLKTSSPTFVGFFVCGMMCRLVYYIKEIPMNEALVVHYNESALSTLFLGSAKVDTKRLTSFLNIYLNDGFSIKAVQREQRRMFLFFKREAFIIFLLKNLS